MFFYCRWMRNKDKSCDRLIMYQYWFSAIDKFYKIVKKYSKSSNNGIKLVLIILSKEG